jgi:hypothetical protein
MPAAQQPLQLLITLRLVQHIGEVGAGQEVGIQQQHQLHSSRAQQRGWDPAMPAGGLWVWASSQDEWQLQLLSKYLETYEWPSTVGRSSQHAQL